MSQNVSAASGSDSLPPVAYETLLGALNRALFRFCSALTIAGENSDELIAGCRSVLRRTLVAELLSRRHMIAIAGTQGTGKTTLVRAIYELDSQWIRANRGQGERMPIFIVEDADVPAPQGHVTTLADDDVEVGPERWAEYMRNDSGEALVMELRVPPRLFPNAPPRTAGLLLLPGYEPQNKQNKLWQELMRQALVGASRVLLVTHEQDIATDSPDYAMKDLRERYLDGALPLIAVTHCEGIADKPDEQEELRATAAKRYQRPPDGVFCTWAAGPSALFLHDLRDALADLGYGLGMNYGTRLQELEGTLTGDLGSLLGQAERAVYDHVDAAVADDEREVGALLRLFDEAETQMRAQYERVLRSELLRTRNAALSRVAKLHEQQEGWENQWDRAVNWLSLRPSKTRTAWEALVMTAWSDDADGRSPVTRVLPDIFKQVVERQYTKAGLGTPLTWEARTETTANSGASSSVEWQLEADPTPHEEFAVSVLKEVRRLATIDHETTVSKPSGELDTAIKLLPALTLEWAYLGSLVPEFVGLDRVTLEPAPDEKINEKMKQFEAGLHEWDEVQRETIRVWASIAGLAGMKNEITTVQGLVAAARGGAGTAVGRAVANVVAGSIAATATAVVTIDMLNRGLLARRSAAESAIQAIYTTELRNRTEVYDELMRLAREILADKLRRVYGLKSDTARREWLRLTLQSVKTQRADLLEILRGHLGTLG